MTSEVVYTYICMYIRVQWFLLFFVFSLWVRWIWVGIKILRLVYKKPFFKILSGFLRISPFVFQKRGPHPLYRFKKFFFEKGHMGYQKIRNFALISNMCLSLALKKFSIFFPPKNAFCIKNFLSPKKISFLGKKNRKFFF